MNFLMSKFTLKITQEQNVDRIFQTNATGLFYSLQVEVQMGLHMNL